MFRYQPSHTAAEEGVKGHRLTQTLTNRWSACLWAAKTRSLLLSVSLMNHTSLRCMHTASRLFERDSSGLTGISATQRLSEGCGGIQCWRMRLYCVHFYISVSDRVSFDLWCIPSWSVCVFVRVLHVWAFESMCMSVWANLAQRMWSINCPTIVIGSPAARGKEWSHD